MKVHQVKPHNWQPHRKAEKKNGKGVLEKGCWYRCSECQFEIFRSDTDSDFTFQLAITLMFTHLVIDVLPVEAGERSLKREDDKYFDEIGYHGILAENCEEAKKFQVECVLVT